MNNCENRNNEEITPVFNSDKEWGALSTKIMDLTERLQVFAWGLQNYFVDAYLNSDPSRSLEQINYKKRKHRANADIEEVQAEYQAFKKKNHDGCDRNAKDIGKAYNKLTAVVASYNDLCTVVDGVKILEAADHDFQSLKYIDAVIKTKELQNKLDEIEFEGNLNIALENLKQQNENQLALSLAHLGLDWADLFQWSFKKGVDTLTCSLSVQQNDPVLLQKQLKALYLTNQINAELNSFSEFFINKLLINIINHNCEIFTEDHIGALVFNIKLDLKDSKQPSIQNIFNNLTAVFEFLESTIESNFEADKKFLDYFGDNNRQAFFNMIIDHCVKRYLPISEQSYQIYKEIAMELDSFNKFLIKLSYVSEEESPLKKYIDKSPLLLYTKKCEKLLSDVREITKNPLPQGTAIVGTVLDVEDKSVFDVQEQEFSFDLTTPMFFPRCVISESVMQIAKLIVDHLEESSSLSEEYGKQLVLYIKDIATMYSSLVPETIKQILKDNSLEIAIFFNNCNYLAHTLMGPPWKNILPKYLADYLNTILTEQIYDLRIVGLEKISLYLADRKQQISDNIRSISLPWSEETFELFDTAVTSVMSDLRSLKGNWYNILPNRMYVQSMCSLISTLCEAMMSQLFLNTNPISEDLSYMISLRFQCTVTEIGELIPEPIDFSAKIKHWKKFTDIQVLFKIHLIEITSMWNVKTELSSDFTCEEIRQVIKMRFPDNKYRFNILKEIQ